MNPAGGYDIEDLQVGMQASFSKTIGMQDIALFGQVSGDNNALHLDEAYARTTAFGGCIAHGMLTASLISAAFARHLPGAGAVYLSQCIEFIAPVRPNDTVTATVTVSELDPIACRVVFRTTCHVGECCVLQGEAALKTTSQARRNAQTVI